jgi:SET and MYND domain-containing protein
MVFPANMTDDTAAQLLAILNTNSLELDGQMTSGSGLFVLTRMLEASCLPNCSYTTHGDELWVTAIKPIAKGESLTVDFNDNFYRPLQERQEDIFARYVDHLYSCFLLVFSLNLCSLCSCFFFFSQ